VTLARAMALLAAVLVVGATAGAPRRAHAAHDWNEGAIAWKSLDEGLALAKKEQKPLLLVVYTEWCPHCANYAKVFHDSKVVEKAKQLVMVRLDQDTDKATAQKYAPDGGYIPRTLFFAPDGTLAPDVHAPRPQYKYFYDEKDPASVLAGMDAALAKLRPKKQ
jgi:protein-disulfide reductase (glutathione)